MNVTPSLTGEREKIISIDSKCERNRYYGERTSVDEQTQEDSHVPTVRTLRNRLFSERQSTPSSEKLADALQPYLDTDEELVHNLVGSSELVFEKNGQTEQLSVPEGEPPVVVVTDTKLLFAVVSDEDEQVVEVPYVDVRNVDVDDGLLRSTLSVDIWPTGTYRMKTNDSDTLSAAVSYVVEATDCWQYAMAMVEQATERTDAVGAAIEDGRLAEAREAREEIHAKLNRARNAIEEADVTALPTLESNVDEAEATVYRTEMHARLSHAATLMTEAKHQTDARAYTGAYRRYWKARDHLETARVLARRADVEEPPIIESQLATIETHLDGLRVRPLALAKQARERANKTVKPDVRVEALAEAFEHYRDALTAGWGTDFEFAGQTDSLRSEIETIVDALVEARCVYAESLADRAQNHSSDERYAEKTKRRAREQLDAAADLAAEFRAGDEARIEEATWYLESRCQ